MANKDFQEGYYVNLDAAIALSKIGYEDPQHPLYAVGMDTFLIRPSLQKATEWLRERHHISLRINYAMSTRKWFFDFLNMEDGSYDDSTSSFDSTTGYYDNYNDAVNAGIVAVCDYIKEL